MRISLKISLCLLLFVSFSLLQASPSAPENSVKFEQPEKYTDFEDRRYSLERSQKSLMADFGPQVSRLLTRFLPEGNTMQIVFTNIDMAGWISPGTAPDYIRVIRNIDKAKLDFNYKWFDTQGQLLKEDKVTLLERNLQFLKNQTKKYSTSNLSYELAMIERWLRELTEQD